MTLAEEVADLQTRLAEAQRARARAEGTRDAAQEALDRARKELLDEFGCSTAAEAEELLEGLHTDLQLIVTTMTGKLTQIGV